MFRAAKYLGVPPWDLAEKPLFWQAWAIEFEQAEIWAEIEDAKRHRHQHSRGGQLQ